jgi:hypothetical protein
MKIRRPRDRRYRIALVEIGEIAARLFPHECAELEERIRCARQPSTLYGSPESIIDRGVARGITETARWAERIVNAIGNADNPDAIRSRTRAAAKGNSLKAFARNTYERLLHGAALGALDANWEYETGGTVAQPKFADIPPLPSYADKPFAEAISWFRSKKVLTPEAFRALDAAAKRRAFTVARMANEDLLRVVHAELARQLEQGADLASFQRFAKERLESAGWVPANRSHVELVFRNNVVGAHGAGRRRQMFQPEVIRARPIIQLKGVGDDRMRPRHKRANGKAARASDPVFRHLWTPLGHNCFLPGAVIEGAIVGASRARYRGKAIELTTAKGRRLAVTPNHPVLTAERGFVAAASLRVGVNLVGYGGQSGIAALGQRAQRDEHHEPTAVDQVFGALAQAFSVALTGQRPEDFHGEAARFDGEIEVVGSYGQLLGYSPAARGEQGTELILETPTFPVGRDGPGAGSYTPGRIAGAPSGLPRRGELAIDDSAISSAPLRAFRFGLGAQLDAASLQRRAHGLAADAVLIGQLLERGAGAVALDQLIEVREFDYAGHVFDLESTTGWIVADGVIASNCRCRFVSRTEEEAQRLGIDIVSGSVLEAAQDPGWESRGGSL